MDAFIQSPKFYYTMIMTLRIFLLREKDPDRWALIWNLESHKTEEQSQRVLSFFAAVVEKLQISIGLPKKDIPTITTIMRITYVNCFKKLSGEESNITNSSMISIVYGSLEAGLPNNRAAFVGCHDRHLCPIFANWLYQLPTLPLPLFTCHAKVAILSDSLFLTLLLFLNDI
jgi:hypothetical protein